MKKRDLTLQHSLTGITAFLAILTLLNYNFLLLLLLWLIPFGASQVIHSFIIAVNYWKDKKIRTAICIYWLAAALDLLLLFYPVDSNSDDDHFYWFAVYIPLFIATYLWFITWHFRNEKITMEEEQAQQNYVTQ